MTDLPTGTLTLLFTDIEGSTRMLDELGAQAYARVLAEHHALIRESFAAHGGHELGTEGDAFFVGFQTAGAALAAAADAQRALAATSLRVRMGLHTGEPLQTDTGLVGMAVHRAARIQGLAHGGQVLISAVTRDLVEELPPGVALRYLGEFPLKDFDEPERLWQVCIDGLSTDFPPPRAHRTSSAGGLPVGLERLARGPFVGREDALVRLERALADAGEVQHPTVVTLTGEPGIGKSRLLAEFGVRAHAAGHEVLYGAASPESFVPYEVFVAALSDRVRSSLDELDPGGAELSAEERRYRLFDRVACLVGDLGETQPAVLLLDDQHWADTSTTHLVRHLVRSSRTRGCLVVLGFREAELEGTPLETLVTDLHRDAPLTQIALSGLTASEIEPLVEAWGAGRALDAGALLARTNGNPFFLRELLRAVADGQESLDAVPEGVRAVVRQRMSRLPADDVSLLGACAVAGPVFDVSLVSSAIGRECTGPQLADIVDSLLQAGLVDETDDHAHLRFTHALIRDAVYESLTGARRTSLHLALAEELERRVGVSPGPHSVEAAHHFHEAGSERAVDHSIAAAQWATDRLAFDQAFLLYTRALRSLPEDDPRRGELAKSIGLTFQLQTHATIDVGSVRSAGDQARSSAG